MINEKMSATLDLYMAFQIGDLDAAKKEIEKGAYINDTFLIGENYSFLEYLMKMIFDLKTRLAFANDTNRREVIKSGIEKNYQMIDLLLDAGFDVNKRIESFDKYDSYLYFWIKNIRRSYFDEDELLLVSKLLKAGADPNAPFDDPNAPQDGPYAHTGYGKSVLHFLIDNMLNPNDNNKIYPHFLPILKLLLEYRVDLSVLDQREISILKECSEYSKIKDIMESLGYQPL